MNLPTVEKASFDLGLTKLLGVHEFCAALNGDDPEDVISVLKKFIRVVRRERYLALCSSSTSEDSLRSQDFLADGYDSSPPEESEDLSEMPQRKKVKVDSWKLDSKLYNVPFVGTSLGIGSTGVVVRNEWPTGFLKAYLEKSPTASEIIQRGKLFVPPYGLFHKILFKRETSRSRLQSKRLHKLHIQALGELLTSLIPKDRLPWVCCLPYILNIEHHSDGGNLIKDDTSSTRYQGIVLPLLKNHLSCLLDVLNEENQGKGAMGKEDNVDLMVAALVTLARLACVSVDAAIMVARGLHSSLKDNVYSLLRWPRNKSNSSKYHPSKLFLKKQDTLVLIEKRLHSQQTSRTSSSRTSLWPRSDIRTACITLATVLLQMNNTVVNSYVITCGNKDCNVSPGIVYWVFRDGLISDVWEVKKGRISELYETEYLSAVQRFFQIIRTTLLVGSTDDFINLVDGISLERGKEGNLREQEKSSSQKVHSLIGLLQDDALVNLTHIAAKANDNVPHQSKSILESAAVEGRNLLFALLIDTRLSPFLRYLHSSENKRGATQVSLAQQITRSIHLMVSTTYDVDLRDKILQCLQNSPFLLPFFYRSLPIVEQRPSFAYFIQMSYIGHLLDNGPSIITSLCATQTFEDRTGEAAGLRDMILVHVLPERLSKSHLTRGIQSDNPLLVCQTLILLMRILRRVELFVRRPASSEKLNRSDWDFIILNAIQKRLPDLQALLAIRSRFDPFRVRDENGSTTSTSHDFIMFYLLGVLKLYGTLFCSSVRSYRFDWVKLLPEDTKHFSVVQPWLHMRVITTLVCIYGLNEYAKRDSENSSDSGTGISPRFSNYLLPLYRNSPKKTLSDFAKTALIQIIRYFLNPACGADVTLTRCCSYYEATQWVEGMNEEILPDICKMFDTAQRQSVQLSLSAIFFWYKNFSGKPCPTATFSMQLASCWTRIMSNTCYYSENFVRFICNVTKKMLVFSPNPLLFAVFIKESIPEQLLRSGQNGSFAVHQLLTSLRRRSLFIIERSLATVALFESTSDTTIVSRDDTQESDVVILAIIMQYLHQFLFPQYKSSKNIEEDCVRIVRQVIIKFLTCRRAPYLFVQQLLMLMDSKMNSSLFSSDALRWLVLTSSKGGKRFTVDSMSYCFEHVPIISMSKQSAYNSFSNTQAKIFVSSIGLIQYAPSVQLGTMLRCLLDHVRAMDEIDFSAKSIHLALATVDLILSHFDVAHKRAMTLVISFPYGIVDMWMKTRYLVLTKKNDFMLAQSVCRKLEDMIVHSLTEPKTYGFFSFALFSCILQNDLQEIITLALEKPANISLVQALLTYDASIVAEPLIEYLLRWNDDTKLGWSIVATRLVTEIVERQICRKCLQSEPFHELANMIAKRLIDEMRMRTVTKADEKEQMRSVERLLLALRPLLVLRIIESDQEKNIWCMIASTLKLTTGSLEDSLIDFLCHRSPFDGTSAPLEIWETRIDLNVCRLVFDRLCQKVPNVVKKARFSETGNRLARVHFHKLQRLARTPGLINVADDVKVFAHLKICVVTCLKYGIADDIGSTSPLCLQTVRLLLHLTATVNKGYIELQDHIFTPSQVFIMATSHSRFEELVCQQKNASKVELLRLLIALMKVDEGNDIQIEKSLVFALLRGYEAGMSAEDKLMRKLLYFCQELAERRNILLLNYEWAWGELQQKRAKLNRQQVQENDLELKVSPDGGEWEWLLEGLDIARVMRTVNNFPVNEYVVPPDDAPSQVYRSTGLSYEQSEETILRGEKNVSFYDMVDSDNGEADRYNPAFLVPLLLGVLHTFYPYRKIELSSTSEIKYVTGRMEYKQLTTDSSACSREKFVKITQRLCRKGVISLILITLSSKCLRLRESSAGILGLCLQAAKMQEAHLLCSWKERPQIEMILNSVQRGVVLTSACTHFSNNDGVALTVLPDKANLPMLPYVSALFLARSAYVLSIPSDDMYPAINRFFLRLEANHGAYQDCHSLPAFVAFFCNSADSIIQAQQERLWALLLLKDGVTDFPCYKAAARRHVIEILMTSLDSMSSRVITNEASVECELLLDTLASIISKGALPSCSLSPFLQKIGLLPWIQYMFKKKYIFESHSLTLKVFILLKVTLTSFAGEMDACTSIASSTLLNTAYLVGFTCTKTFAATCSTSCTSESIELVNHACNILNSISVIINRVNGITDCNKKRKEKLSQPSGLSLDTSIALLHAASVCCSSETALVLVRSLCSLPQCTQSKDFKLAIDFVKRCLSLTLAGASETSDRSDGSGTIHDIMLRMSGWVELIGHCDEADKNQIIHMIMKLKKICFERRETSELWMLCVSRLIRCEPNHENIGQATLESSLEISIDLESSIPSFKH